MVGPVLILHENTGQPQSCLAGLVAYAKEIAKTPEAANLSEDELLGYLWNVPVVFDAGEGPQVAGCRPAQRSRIWPPDLNCWEATAHLAGWMIAHQTPVELHLFDAYLGSLRHVFPAWRAIGEQKNPEPLLLQPPVVGVTPGEVGQRNLATLGIARSVRAGRAQAWYNTIADVAHTVGTVVLSVFGAGAVVPLVEEAWKLAPEEYGLTKNKKDASAQEVAEAKQKTEAAKAAAGAAAVIVAQAAKEAERAEDKKAGVPPPPANALIVPDGRGGYRNYGPPIC